MFLKEYWSRLWVIEELVVSPMTSTVHWGESVFHLSTLQVVGDILVYSESRQSSNSEIWEELNPRLDTDIDYSMEDTGDYIESHKTFVNRRFHPRAEASRTACKLLISS
jgi:hypothetical protein